MSLQGLGAALGGLFGAGGAVGGAALSYKYQKRLMDRQAAHADRQYQHRYQWSREDMLRAGLNPILMSKGSPGSVASPSGGSAPSVDLAGGAAKGAQAGMAAATAKEVLRGYELDNDIREETRFEKSLQNELLEARTLWETDPDVIASMRADKMWGHPAVKRILNFIEGRFAPSDSVDLKGLVGLNDTYKRKRPYANTAADRRKWMREAAARNKQWGMKPPRRPGW